MNTENTALVTLNEKIENKFMQLIKSDQYPVSVRTGINDVMALLKEEKSITDLYPEILAEIPISQSIFQDMCVQYNQHFTPSKKLRQAVMEMQNRLGALYTAKTGQKKSMLKVERINMEIENLNNELSKEENKDDYTQRRFKLTVAEKLVDLEEAQRGLNESSHLIKDALLKVVHQRILVEKFQKEVEESGMSYEESEIHYYVAYFTQGAEQQLRSGDHQVDRGTFGAIAQLPKAIRLKVLSNIAFLKEKIFSPDFNPNCDYLYNTYWDSVLKPKYTGPDEIEGEKISDLLNMEAIKILAKKVEEEINENM